MEVIIEHLGNILSKSPRPMKDTGLLEINKSATLAAAKHLFWAPSCENLLAFAVLQLTVDRYF